MLKNFLKTSLTILTVVLGFILFCVSLSSLACYNAGKYDSFILSLNFLNSFFLEKFFKYAIFLLNISFSIISAMLIIFPLCPDEPTKKKS